MTEQCLTLYYSILEFIISLTCHSPFGFSSSLSKLYTESQLEVSEESKYSIVVEYVKDESHGMGKIIDKYVS